MLVCVTIVHHVSNPEYDHEKAKDLGGDYKVEGLIEVTGECVFEADMFLNAETAAILDVRAIKKSRLKSRITFKNGTHVHTVHEPAQIGRSVVKSAQAKARNECEMVIVPTNDPMVS